MKFSVGYQPRREGGESFPDLLRDYAERVREVYFPWPHSPSGRPPILTDLSAGDAAETLLADLREIRSMGIDLDLLLNANCYGADAVSRAFAGRIADVLETLRDADCFPAVVTAASPFVAWTVKERYPEIEVRASVNMRLGTVQAMGYVSDLFDSFCMQRDLQRDLRVLAPVSRWCRENGKKLCLLVNSGCLRFCPGQTFHDNLIAHCGEIDPDGVPEGFQPHVCWSTFLRHPERRPEILKATWIRPEDLGLYEPYADLFKLATRQHDHPRAVIGAYTSGKWDGDLLNLLEPGFGPAFGGDRLWNDRFPPDFAQTVGRCGGGCTGCGACEQIYETVRTR